MNDFVNDNAVDTTVLDALHELMEDELFELVEVFLIDGAQAMHEIDQAILNQEHAVLHERAHTLKSSSGNIGAMTVSDIAFALEKIGMSGSIAGADELLKSLHLQWQHTHRIMNNYVDNIKRCDT